MLGVLLLMARSAPAAGSVTGAGSAGRAEARAEAGSAAAAQAGAEPRFRAFPALQTAVREQAALVASAGEDPARWPAAVVRAVASAWNAAVLETFRAGVKAPLLREQWNLLVSGAAEAWSGLALVTDSPPAADTLVPLAVDARARGDDTAAILPAVRAAAGGERAALLLTTSVGCECTMRRAALMEEVWTALLARGSGAAGSDGAREPDGAMERVVPMGIGVIGGAPDRDLRPFLGRSDLSSSPDLPDALGLDRVPGWLLLEPGGEIAFRLDGGEGVAEITTMIRRWLGGEDLHR
jgi:hypothetical protein